MTFPPKGDSSSLERRAFFGPHDLTLRDKLVGCQVPQRAVWAVLIVVEPPRLDLRLRIRHGQELVDIQTLIPQAPVERFDERILHRFARPDEIQLDATTIRPSPRALGT